MDVALEVRGDTSGVLLIPAPLKVSAPSVAVVVIDASVKRIRACVSGERRIIVRAERVSERIIEHAPAERASRGNCVATHQIDALLHPVRPLPVTDLHAVGPSVGPEVLTGVRRVILRANLSVVAQRNLIVLILVAELAGHERVAIRGVESFTRRLRRNRSEVAWKQVTVRSAVRTGNQCIEGAAVAANGRIDPVRIGVEAIVRLYFSPTGGFKGPSGLAADNVDCAAQGVGPIQKRGESFTHYHLGNVVHAETGQVDVAIVRDIDGYTVNKYRDLPAVEAANGNRPLATLTGILYGRARNEIEGFRQVIAMALRQHLGT